MRARVAGLLLIAACSSKSTTTPWAPGQTRPSARTERRGLTDVRGIIHAHSIYSHDACDGEPEKDGVRDAQCLADLRRGLCEAGHDFVMLTDHSDAFAQTEFPETLLYRPELEDEVHERGGRAVASTIHCEGGHEVMLLAGTESAVMAVGLEGHLDDRSQYGRAEAPAIDSMHERGAVVLLQHTEDWTVDQLTTLPVDGFEMYNLHANTLRAAGNVLELLLRLDRGDTDLMHPDLTFLAIVSEDERYLSKWSEALARGAKRVTTMGTDCHRNTFKAELSDGERVDSYRRMMIWFSNHLLVDGPGDEALKRALAGGRLYGAFEAFGYPVGFDFFAGAHEMGDAVALTERPTLEVKAPTVQDLDPDAPAPKITTHLLRATREGWEEVARGDASLSFTPSVAGAYRAEVRIVPRHLTAALASYGALAEQSFVWIYANPIYVD